MLSLALTQQTLGAAVKVADRVWTDYKPKERKTNLFILHRGMNALSKKIAAFSNTNEYLISGRTLHHGSEKNLPEAEANCQVRYG